MELSYLSIRDPDVQEMLWKYMEPTDMHHEYTKIDCIKEIERQCYEKECVLIGSVKDNLLYKCLRRNDKVLEPHIMGDGTKIRGGLLAGAPLVWNLGYEKIAIWTQHSQIARIVSKCGFNLVSTIPGLHKYNGELVDIFVLVMEKPNE